MESSLKFTQEDWPGKKEALEEEERRETIDEKFDNIETALLTLLEKEKEKKKELEQDKRELFLKLGRETPEKAKETLQDLARILSDTNQRMLKMGRENPEDGETTEEEKEEKEDHGCFIHTKNGPLFFEDSLEAELAKKNQETKELKRKIEAKKLESSRKRKLSKLLQEMGASEDQKMVVNWILRKNQGIAQISMTDFVRTVVHHENSIKKS